MCKNVSFTVRRLKAYHQLKWHWRRFCCYFTHVGGEKNDDTDIILAVRAAEVEEMPFTPTPRAFVQKKKKKWTQQQSGNLNPACRFLLPPPAHPHFIYSNQTYSVNYYLFSFKNRSFPILFLSSQSIRLLI